MNKLFIMAILTITAQGVKWGVVEDEKSWDKEGAQKAVADDTTKDLAFAYCILEIHEKTNEMIEKVGTALAEKLKGWFKGEKP